MKLSRIYKEIKFQLSYWYENNSLRDLYTFVTRRFWERLESAFSYAKLGWKSYDWDYHYINEFLLFKLKRMLKNFKKGYHSEDCEYYKPKMKSLKLAMKIMDLYINDQNRYMKFYDLHNKKWGGKVMTTTPSAVDPDGYVRTYNLTFEYIKKLNKEEQEIEKKEMLEAFKKDEKRRQRDIALFYKIVSKYHNQWWD